MFFLQTHERFRREANASGTGSQPLILVQPDSEPSYIRLGIFLSIVPVIIIICFTMARRRSRTLNITHDPETQQVPKRDSPSRHGQSNDVDFELVDLSNVFERDVESQIGSDTRTEKQDDFTTKCRENFIDEYLQKYKSEQAQSPQNVDFIEDYVNRYKTWIEKSCEPGVPIDTIVEKYKTDICKTHGQRESLVGEFLEDYKEWRNTHAGTEVPKLQETTKNLSNVSKNLTVAKKNSKKQFKKWSIFRAKHSTKEQSQPPKAELTKSQALELQRVCENYRWNVMSAGKPITYDEAADQVEQFKDLFVRLMILGKMNEKLYFKTLNSPDEFIAYMKLMIEECEG